MTLNELREIKDLFVYMTLSDIPLFTKDNKVANEIIREIRRKAGQDVGVEDIDAIEDINLKAEKEKESAPYFQKYFMDELIKHEEYIDVDKYILISAFRNAEILQNIYILKNGGGAFPKELKGLLPLRKEYATSLLKLSELMEGRTVRINYKAGIYDGVPQGYWNDFSQEFESLDLSSDDIKRFIASPAYRDALGLPLKTPAVIDGKKFTGTKSLEDVVEQINNEVIKQQSNVTEIVRYALEHHGIQKVGKKVFAYSPYGQAEIGSDSVRKIREGYEKTVDDVLSLIQDHPEEVDINDLVESIIPAYEISFNEILKSKSISRKQDTILKLYSALMRDNPDLRELTRVAMMEYVHETPYRTSHEEALSVSKDSSTNTVLKREEEIKNVRIDIVMNLFSYGIIDFDIIRDNPDFVAMLSTEKVIDKYYKSLGILPKKEAIKLAAKTCMSGIGETDAETLAIKYHYNKVNKPEGGLKRSTLRNILEILPEEELRRIYVKGILDKEDLQRRGITPDNILEDDSLSEEELINLVEYADLDYGMFAILEPQIIARYGKNLSRKGTMIYAKRGRITEPTLLELYLREDLRLKEGFEYITEDDVLGLLDFDRLNRLSSKEINSRFIENFNKVLANTPKEKVEAYFDKLISDIEKQEKKENAYFNFYKNGILDKSFLEGKLSKEFIEEMYSLDKLPEDELFKLYEEGIIDIEHVGGILTYDDIFENVLEGKMDYRALRDLPADYIELAVEEGTLGLNELMMLYKDSLDFGRLKSVLDTVDLSNIELGKFIADGTDREKVEELIKGEYLSHDEISDLVARGLVDKDKADEYVEMLSSIEEFKKLFDTEDRRAQLTEATEKGEYVEKSEPVGPTDPVKTRQKINPDLQERFMQVLGAYPNIIYLEGIQNSLNGYSIFGFKDEGIMIFLNLEKKAQATYVMSFLQGKYYINKILKAKFHGKQIEIKEGLESSATKGEIRSDTEHVKIKYACKGWGKNIVQAMKKVSPKFKEKYKRNQTYRDSIEKLSEEIGRDYEERLEDASL